MRRLWVLRLISGSLPLMLGVTLLAVSMSSAAAAQSTTDTATAPDEPVQTSAIQAQPSSQTPRPGQTPGPGWSTSTSTVDPSGRISTSAGSSFVESGMLARNTPTPATAIVAPLRASVSQPISEPSYPRAGGFRVKPFRQYAVQVKGGFAGIGVDVATPLAQRFNLRAGASFFQYSGSYSIDGILIDGEAKFRSATAQVDIFPFNNAFRISLGATVYNGNNLNAVAMVPGGQSFDLGDGSYTSSPYDPVHGTASLTFGNRTAPSVTVGFGNMIPRNGRHWSVPFEIGFQYIADPKIDIVLGGTACYEGVYCAPISSDPQTQADLQQEIDEVNSDIHPLRFYPIISTGVAYRF